MGVENPLYYAALMLGIGLIPFLLLGLTSFIKISVVLGILRNALGAGQIPSSAVSSLLALVLSIHVMAPVGRELIARVSATDSLSTVQDAVSDFSKLSRVLEDIGAPLLDFLRRHSRLEERVFFSNLAQLQRQLGEQGKTGEQARRLLREVDLLEHSCDAHRRDAKNCALPGENFLSIIPAFVLSELRQAFAIGFTIFLPFLVIDLVVANILVGMGMMMVSPVSIALPFKILLFVVADGWFLLCRSLVTGYL